MPTISFLHPRVVADRRWSQSPPLGIDRPTEGREFETRRLRSFRTSPERVLFRRSWPAIQPAKHSARRKLSNASRMRAIVVRCRMPAVSADKALLKTLERQSIRIGRKPKYARWRNRREGPRADLRP